MEILIIGGTQFVGRHLADELLRLGHDLTFFHRGETNPDLFPQAERIFGDRTMDLANLGDRTWDVVIDTIGYHPEHVEDSVGYLEDRTDRYVFISSAAVYEPTTRPGIDEDAPVQTEPPVGEGVEWWHTEYARNKVACEAIVRETFGESNALIIRPGMLMGPHDPINMFTYWVVRMHRGGDVVAPDVRDQPLQFLDGRDLAAFTADMVDRGVADVFTVDGPEEPITYGSFLETLRETVGTAATIHWLDPEWLLDQGVHPPWEELPYWLPGEAVEGYCRMSNEKAMDHGLTVRPLAQTTRDVLEWYRREDVGDREEWVDGLPPHRGIDPGEEADLLERSRAA